MKSVHGRRNGYAHILVWASLSPLGLFLVFYWLIPTLNPMTVDQARNSFESSIVFYDRKGEPLREAANRHGYRAIWVDLEDVDSFFLDALIAAEDQRFYRHGGVDYLAAGRAFLNAVTARGPRSGASTISMQLARLLNDSSRSAFGKLLQIIDARRIESGMSKEHILELYINMVDIGRGTKGLEAASQRYFGTAQHLLSRGQSALLVGIIKGPGYYDPYRHPQRADARKSYVLNRLLVQGLITPEEKERIHLQQLNLNHQTALPQAMHFTDFLIQSSILSGQVRTSLDAGLNRQIQDIVSAHVKALGAQGLKHAAVVVVDNQSMQVLAMVGSPDYWDKDQGSNNGVIVLRQPGSTIKPFTYALAFEQGWSPADMIADIPLTYMGSEGRLYQPVNFTHTFYGPVLLEDALSRSLNIPAVRLLDDIGLDTLIAKMKDLGFAGIQKPQEHFGLSLTLGAIDVSLLEMTRAYSAFANKGYLRELVYLADDQADSGTRVFSEKSSYLVSDILSSNRLRIRAFGTRHPLLFSFPISLKTGTSNNWRDNWIIGYTRRFSLGVWTGDFSGAPSNQFAATVGAGPLFQRVANLVRDYYGPGQDAPWTQMPENLFRTEVCAISGALPGPDCQQTTWAIVQGDPQLRETCQVHQRIAIDSRTGLLAREDQGSEYTIYRSYEILPPEYSVWENDQQRERPPRSYSPLQTVTPYQVVYPYHGDIFIFEPGYDADTQSVELKAVSHVSEDQLYWYVNGKVHEKVGWPYTGTLPKKPGRYVISFGDQALRSNSIEILIK